MFGRIIEKIFFECWYRHEWVDIGNGKLTYDGKILAQCAVCFKTKSFLPHRAKSFITYDQWIERMQKCDNCLKLVGEPLLQWPSTGGEFMVVCAKCYKKLNAGLNDANAKD